MTVEQSKEPVLECRDLRASLGDGERAIEASFRLAAGSTLQVAGPSGCGKTTLLRILARLDARDSGELLLRGEPAARIPPARWRRQVIHLAQHPVMLEGTVRDNLEAGFTTNTAHPLPDAADRQQEARRLLGALLLDPDELLVQDARTLSGGEAARVALIRALLVAPPVLLADEPTASLDPDGASALVRVLTGWIGRGGALVLVAHDGAPWEGVEREVLELG